MYARRASCPRHSSRCLVAKLSRVSALQRRGSPGKYLLQNWATTRGKRLAPYWTFVNSGYLPTEVYKFCRSGTHRFPTKGIGTASMPWVEPTPEKRHGLLHIRTDAGKRLLIRSSDRYGSEPRQFGNRGRFLQSVRRFAGSEPGAGAGIRETA